MQEAAKEIQRVVKLCAGAELPLARQPAERMICLGDNKASRKAGVALAADAADDSFILRTVGESVFIVGKDSPDQPRPQPGWASRGKSGQGRAVFDIIRQRCQDEIQHGGRMGAAGRERVLSGDCRAARGIAQASPAAAEAPVLLLSGWKCP